MAPNRIGSAPFVKFLTVLSQSRQDRFYGLRQALSLLSS